MLLNLGQLAIGLVVVTLGASWLVKGASRLALRFGIPPLIIGLTVVAFGTSAPELAVSITSALAGQSDLAVANVVGSNIFNVLFILGLSALITPLVVHQQLVRMDLPVMIGMSLLLYVLSLDARLDLVDSVLLVALIIGYTIFLLREARRQGVAAASKDAPIVPGKLPFNLALVVLGLVGLVMGSNVMVTGAVGLARLLGVSETVIGLTIIAAGTSLPEVATSVTAAIKGERDIAIGNVVGSNIFNIGSVLGFSGLASLGTLTISPAMLAVDVPLMLAVSMLCLPFFRTGYQLTRANGAALMTGQVAYVAWLVLTEQRSPALPVLELIVVRGFLPALIIGTVAVMVKSLRDEKAGAHQQA
ncbi:MAG: calcium/sodium antiporter [Myxococcales bacterium]|nr:calcium/sodium antiporter [Myxococcales bacterium]